MTRIFHHTTSKMTMVMLSLALLFAFTAQRAAASEGTENKNKETTDAGTTVETNTNAMATPASASPSIAYHAFGEAMKAQPEPKPTGNLKPVGMVKVPVAGSIENIPLPSPMPQPKPAVSTAPMTVGEKFHYWFKSSFRSPGAYAQSAFSGLYGELLDNDDNKKDTVGNYFADAGTRAVRSFTFRATSGFFEKFLYASALRQDPRYHRSGKKGAGAKLMYAVTRVFITQGDRCGCNQFNASFLAGGLTASFIANEWERDERSSVGKAFSRWTTHIALTALSNVIKEFVGGQ
jgi:hypothetical protein